MLFFLRGMLPIILAAALAQPNASEALRQPFSGKQLANGAGKLVDDPEAPGRQVWQVEKAYDFGAAPDVEPGLYRLTLRLKRTTEEQGSLRLGATSGNQSAGAPFQDLPPAVTPEELPEVGRWYEITRIVRFTRPRYWSYVIGTWPGLRLDRISVDRVVEPVFLQEIRTGKLLYHRGERAGVAVRLVNTTSRVQHAQIRVRVESGLNEDHPGVTQDVTLPAPTSQQRLDGKDAVEIRLPLPALAEYGNGVVVEALQPSRPAQELREYCYSSDRPIQVGQYFGWRFPDDYTCSNTPQFLEQMRRTYFPVAECYFWAPCENSLLAPEMERWWSGQTLLRVGKKPLQETIRQGHAQGCSFISYATRWGFGWRMWEFARRHPDLVQWEMGPWQPSYDVAHMEIEKRERDEEHTGLNSTGVLTEAWGNPEAVQYHVRQLQESMRMFGWDGFRYDNGSPVLDEVRDIFGRALPLPGWTHAKVIAALRGGIRQGNPAAIYGNNTGWNLDVDSQPRADDPYTQQIRDGGLVMQEGETNGTIPHRSFAEEASRYTRAGYNALRFGGHQVNIIDPNLTGPDHFFQAALTVAGSCHMAYGVRDELRPVMQLVCRHDDLFYGDGLRFILRPRTPVVEVKAPDQILWRDFVRYRQVSSARRQYLVHLFNAPTGKLGETKDSRYPDPVAGVETTWSLPPGWKTSAAYELTADGGYRKTPLPFQVAGRKVSITLPRLQHWSIIVLDCVGPVSLRQRTPSRVVADRDKVPASGGTGPSLTGPSLTGPAMVMSAGGEVAGTSIVIRYLPGSRPVVRRASEFKISGAEVVQTPGARGGSALRIGVRGLGEGIGFAPEVVQPGRYRLIIRAMTLVPAPTNGALSGLFSAANNGFTPGVHLIQNEFRFTGAQFPQPGQWTELKVEGELTYPNYWCAVVGGWDGLLLDTIRLERVRSLTREELARHVERPWRAALARTARQGDRPEARAWFGAGLYYQLTGLPEALSTLGVRVDLAKAWRFRGPVGFSLPFPKTPKELAGYDLVILADCEVRTLTPEQQLWLDGYVRDGGRLLLLGGPYGFGCGGWQDAQLLADVLPVTLTAHDLRFVGANAPVALQPSSDLARRADWSAHPVILWQHALQPKAGATVHVKAGDAPVIISGVYDRGAVMVMGAAPLGEAPKGSTAYWEWPGWKGLLVGLVRNLLADPPPVTER